jgi:hypothetical protein
MSAIFLLVNMEMTIVFSVDLSLWAGLILATIAAAVYIIHAYKLPTVRFPLLQHNGIMLINGSAHCPREDMIQGVVYITSYKSLCPRI